MCCSSASVRITPRQQEAGVDDDSGFSWKFQIVLESTPKKIGDYCKNFARSIAVVPDGWSERCEEEAAAGLMFSFPRSGELKEYSQQTIWRFCLHENMSYILEIIKTEVFDVRGTYSSQVNKPTYTFWVVEIYHDRWTALLAGSHDEVSQDRPPNIHLDQIFPDADNALDAQSGLRKFVSTMRGITDALSHSAKGDD